MKHFVFCFIFFHFMVFLQRRKTKVALREMETDQLLRLRYTHAHTPPSIQMRSFRKWKFTLSIWGKSGVTEVSHRCTKTFILFSFSCQLPQVRSFSPLHSCSLYFFAPLRTTDANHFPACMHRFYRSSSSPPRTIRDERGKRRLAFKLSSP